MACDKNHRAATESARRNGIVAETSKYAAYSGRTNTAGEVINGNHNGARRRLTARTARRSGTAKNNARTLGQVPAPGIRQAATERLSGGSDPERHNANRDGDGTNSYSARSGAVGSLGAVTGGVDTPADRRGAGGKRVAPQHCSRCGRFIGASLACQACNFRDVLKEAGRIDWEEVAARSGVSVTQAQEYLSRIGLAFKDPRSGNWETADTYLTGNLRAKLREAEAAAVASPAFRANVEVLRKIQPRELQPGEIAAPLGAGWIPEQYIEEFAQELGLGRIKVDYVVSLGKWIVSSGRKSQRRLGANNKKWGTSYVKATDLLEQALNGAEPTVTRRGQTDLDATYEARDKQQHLKEAFEQWIWSDKRRAERLARIYNDRFNATVRSKYDGSHLTDPLPGMSSKKKLRPHQRDAIARLLHSPDNTLLAHLTGAGKSLVMIVGTRERRRLGLTKKAVHVVPNHRPADHARDFLEAYPDAKLLVVTSDDLSGPKYNQTLAHIAEYGDQYDAVIMSHSAAERIGMRPETEIEFVRQKILEYDQTISRLPAHATKKLRLLQTARDRTEKKLQKLLEEAPEADNSRLTWEDLGFDYLCLDEAHRVKNLEFATRKQGIAGINPAGSARAMDMFMKVRYLQERCDRCGKFVGESRLCPHCTNLIEERSVGKICFATATPLGNSIAEIYTWQRFLQPKRLKKLGLEHFDAWSAQFARPANIIELAPFGNGYREATRFTSFINVPELSTILGDVADVQLDPQALNLPLPKLIGGGPKIVTVPMSERLRAYMTQCDERAARVRAREVRPNVDNFLKIANDLTAASLDMRLVDPTAPDDPNSKINTLVREVIDIYKKTTGVALPGVPGRQNLAQVIFLDLSTPKKGFNLYDDIKAKLIVNGIPAEEVAFIHDAKNAEAKQRLFDQVNQGKVRVLLTSTDLGGEAANYQRLLYHCHNADIAWTSTKYIQRLGRLIRQGNLCPQVGNSVYVTTGSFDKYRWQTVERKAFAADQLLKGDIDERTVEDLDVVHVDYATIKAMASGNPLVERRVKLQLDIQRYQALERVYNNRREEAQKGIDQALADIALIGREAVKTDEHQATREELQEKITEYRAALAEPFEYAITLKNLKQELEQVEREIEIMNQPERKKKSLTGRIISSFFRWG